MFEQISNFDSCLIVVPIVIVIFLRQQSITSLSVYWPHHRRWYKQPGSSPTSQSVCLRSVCHVTNNRLGSSFIHKIIIFALVIITSNQHHVAALFSAVLTAILALIAGTTLFYHLRHVCVVTWSDMNSWFVLIQYVIYPCDDWLLHITSSTVSRKLNILINWSRFCDPRGVAPHKHLT